MIFDEFVIFATMDTQKILTCSVYLGISTTKSFCHRVIVSFHASKYSSIRSLVLRVKKIYCTFQSVSGYVTMKFPFFTRHQCDKCQLRHVRKPTRQLRLKSPCGVTGD